MKTHMYIYIYLCVVHINSIAHAEETHIPFIDVHDWFQVGMS